MERECSAFIIMSKNLFQSGNNKDGRNPKLVIVCGVSGSGKTRLARQYEALGMVRLSVDELIWSEYGKDFSSLPPSEQKEITLRTEETIGSLLSNLLEVGRDVVVDGCLCKRFKRDALVEIARKKMASVEGIYLTAPDDVILERLARRRGLGPNDIVVTPQEFSRFRKNFQVPESDEGFRIIVTAD